ncbi:unnamed protein product [Dibothriocephalus latus]|uniref:Uncharacterized protein n=1 Tax=Dibothriocephalus latus TaxID=60516 RepID=A0A3P6U4W7_DIBLA|nr:unnamed protein product [Dibothriocephalus latus]
MKHTHPVTPELATLYPKRRKLQSEFYVKDPSSSLAAGFRYEETSTEPERVCPKKPLNVFSYVQKNSQSPQESLIRPQTTILKSKSCFPTELGEISFTSKQTVLNTDSQAVTIDPLKMSNGPWFTTTESAHVPELQ